MINKSLSVVLVLLVVAGGTFAATTRIPFRMVNNLIVFQATVEGQTGNFIFDTGMANMLLNGRCFHFHHRFHTQSIKEFGADHSIHSLYGTSESSWTGYMDIQVSGLIIANRTTVLDLRAIERRKKMNILGVLGIKALRKYELTIDYDTQEILLSRNRHKNTLLAIETYPALCDTLSFEYNQHIITISAWLGGEELKLGLDSGAEMNVLSLQTLASREDQVERLTEKKFMDFSGTVAVAQSGYLEGLQIGQLHISTMEMIFLPIMRLKEFSGAAIDGLLGQEFMKHFRITFNFKKREIYCWHNETIRNPTLALRKRK